MLLLQPLPDRQTMYEPHAVFNDALVALDLGFSRCSFFRFPVCLVWYRLVETKEQEEGGGDTP